MRGLNESEQRGPWPRLRIRLQIVYQWLHVFKATYKLGNHTSTDVKSLHLVKGRETRIEQVNKMNEEQLRIVFACGSGGRSRRNGGKKCWVEGVCSETHAN